MGQRGAVILRGVRELTFFRCFLVSGLVRLLTTRKKGSRGRGDGIGCIAGIAQSSCVSQEPEARPGQDGPASAAGAVSPPRPEPARGHELTAKLGTDSHTFVAILAVGHPPVFWVLLRCVKQVSEIGAVQTPPPRVQAPSHPTPSLHPSQCLSASAGPSENQKSCSRPVSTERLGLSAKPGRKQSKSPCSARPISQKKTMYMIPPICLHRPGRFAPAHPKDEDDEDDGDCDGDSPWL